MDYTMYSLQLLISCYSDISFRIFDMDSFNFNSLAWITLTSTHYISHASDKLASRTLTCSLSQLWQAHSHNSDTLTFTTDMLALSTLIFSLLKLWQTWFHCSDMLTLTSLTIWLWWEEAGSIGYSFSDGGGSVIPVCSDTVFTGSGESGFTDRMPAGVDPASLVGVKHPVLVEVSRASLVAVDQASLVGWTWPRW